MSEDIKPPRIINDKPRSLDTMLYGTFTDENLTLNDCLFESADKPEPPQISQSEQLIMLQKLATEGN